MPRDIKLREGLQEQIQRLRRILDQMEEELHKRGIDTIRTEGRYQSEPYPTKAYLDKEIDTNRTKTGIPGKSEDTNESKKDISD